MTSFGRGQLQHLIKGETARENSAMTALGRSASGRIADRKKPKGMTEDAT